MRKPFVASFAFVAVALLALPMATAPACFPQGACDATWSIYCTPQDTACRGRLIDDTHWESSALDGKWVSFPKNGTIRIDPRDGTGRKAKGAFVRTQAWISACEVPSTPGCNFAFAAGNNAEWHWFDGDRNLDIRNNTCEDFFVRVVIDTDGIEASDASSQDGTIAGDATTD